MSRSGGGAAAAGPAHDAVRWRLGRRLLQPPGRPLVMGILNLTPDSFYPASRQTTVGIAVNAALRMIEEGADLLDLGAESSRPGSDRVTPTEERKRLLPVLIELRRTSEIPVTVDTIRAETARFALDNGADGVNDITAGRHDPDMLPLAAATGCGLVLMHMLGDPKTMQQRPSYDDVTLTISRFFAERCAAAVEAGIAPDRIAVDPGIGFGKLLEHNLTLLASLRRLAAGRPLLVGASRKSFIEHATGAPVQERLPGSLAALAAAHRAGATVVRVHDVAASRQFLEIMAAIDAAGGAEAD